ncbi:MAG: GNAT family N-acetyltransferase [Desulfovibrio sp.]|nr:GNAT family N-acetyltransferase [Desulfovibrio sp.]
MVFREEAAAAVLPEAAELAARHWREVEAGLHGDADYVPDGERYAALEKLGMLSVTTARDEAGRLAGYAVFTLAPCPHLKGETVAALDGLYLTPRARRGLNALGLLRSAEAAVAARGASLAQYSSPASRPCDALYRRLGAAHTETIWHKRLHGGK